MIVNPPSVPDFPDWWPPYMTRSTSGALDDYYPNWIPHRSMYRTQASMISGYAPGWRSVVKHFSLHEAAWTILKRLMRAAILHGVTNRFFYTPAEISCHLAVSSSRYNIILSAEDKFCKRLLPFISWPTFSNSWWVRETHDTNPCWSRLSVPSLRSVGGPPPSHAQLFFPIYAKKCEPVAKISCLITLVRHRCYSGSRNPYPNWTAHWAHHPSLSLNIYELPYMVASWRRISVKCGY